MVTKSRLKFNVAILKDKCPNCGKNLLAFAWNNACWSQQCDNGNCALYRQGEAVKPEYMKIDEQLTKAHKNNLVKEVKAQSTVIPLALLNTKRGGAN